MTDRRQFAAGLLAMGVIGIAGSPTRAARPPAALPPKSPAGIATTALSMHLDGLGVTPGLRNDPVRYLDYVRSLGAGGLQHAVSTDLPRFKARLEELGMWYEGEARLPNSLSDDLMGFEQSCRNSAFLGAKVVRAVSRPPAGTSGRRYEAFTSYEQYKAWEKEADAIVEKCLPIAERHKVAIALENHKDRTGEELAGFLKRTSSEYLGTLVDPGNSLALMEDVDETLALIGPYAKACSLKDMGLAPYPDGFLLSEVPFGTGRFDQKAIFDRLRRYNPAIHPTTELITRDPLRVPMLTDDYYRSLPMRRARRESWMAMVKARQTMLPTVGQLTPAQRLQAEEDNNRAVMDWGRRHLA